MDTLKLERPTVVSILKDAFKSGLAIDAAKDHTGICIFENDTVTTYGFALDEIDQEKDMHWEYRMRLDFKNKLASYIEGKYFDVIVIEGCYGGKNFDTVRKLLALNTVIDELIFDNRVFCREFYRVSEPTWMSHFRKIFKTQPGMDVKAETQQILEYLNFDFYMENKDNPNGDRDADKLGVQSKTSIFFEDRCDATGQLLSIAVMKAHTSPETETKKEYKFSDIKFEYINMPVPELSFIKDKIMLANKPQTVVLNTRNIKQSMLDAIYIYPDSVCIAEIKPSKLGVFGLNYNLPFYDDDEGWLVFYNKKSEVLKKSVQK